MCRRIPAASKCDADEREAGGRAAAPSANREFGEPPSQKSPLVKYEMQRLEMFALMASQIV